MRYLLLSLTILACWAAEAEVTLPADVQAALDKSGGAIAKAQARADVEIMKHRQSLIKDLTRLQESYTKKGDLETALAVKALLDAENEKVAIALDEKTPKLSASEWIVGRWHLSLSSGWSKIWEFDKKGSVTFAGGPIGTWAVKDTRIQVTWPSGNIEYIDVPKDTTATETTGTSGSGRPFTVVRSK